MNKGFINRNRVYWMNTRGISENKVIVNDDLFNIPDNISNKDDIIIDIKQSDRPFVVGIISSVSDNKRKYYAYENDENGKIRWIENFDTFRYALIYAKVVYTYLSSDKAINYKYDDNTKVLKK